MLSFDSTKGKGSDALQATKKDVSKFLLDLKIVLQSGKNYTLIPRQKNLQDLASIGCYRKKYQES
ncbi:MAG TPA: hypothetical protein GX529_06950 [Firmicutes bacterium]|nr:hypothetical protein [Candidatus Fermentithermobacillaceae bacterium]